MPVDLLVRDLVTLGDQGAVDFARRPTSLLGRTEHELERVELGTFEGVEEGANRAGCAVPGCWSGGGDSFGQGHDGLPS